MLEYEQASLVKTNYVPELIFIDRNRVIREQHNGGDDFFKEQEKNIRETLDTLLKEPVKSAARHAQAALLTQAASALRCRRRFAGEIFESARADCSR